MRKGSMQPVKKILGVALAVLVVFSLINKPLPMIAWYVVAIPSAYFLWIAGRR